MWYPPISGHSRAHKASYTVLTEKGEIGNINSRTVLGPLEAKLEIPKFEVRCAGVREIEWG